jgi:hypothetical protein
MEILGFIGDQLIIAPPYAGALENYISVFPQELHMLVQEYGLREYSSVDEFQDHYFGQQPKTNVHKAYGGTLPF